MKYTYKNEQNEYFNHNKEHGQLNLSRTCSVKPFFYQPLLQFESSYFTIGTTAPSKNPTMDLQIFPPDTTIEINKSQ